MHGVCVSFRENSCYRALRHRSPKTKTATEHFVARPDKLCNQVSESHVVLDAEDPKNTVASETVAREHPGNAPPLVCVMTTRYPLLLTSASLGKRSLSRKVGWMAEKPAVGKVSAMRRLRYYANIRLTSLATEQTPGTPADTEATMQDPGNAPPLRSSGPGAEPNAATEHIVVEAEGSIHARILDTPSLP